MMMPATRWLRQPCGHVVILDAIQGEPDGCPVCRTLEMRDEHDRDNKRERMTERMRRMQGRGRDA